MAGKYPVVWDLDSLYPNPQTAEFRELVDDYATRLKALAEESDALPAIEANDVTATTWAEFLEKYSLVDSDGTSIETFIACHAAADAANKTYQQYEGELAALSPLKSRIATNVEFAFQAPDEDTLEAFVDLNITLKMNEYFLKLRRRNAALRLPREQELLAADLDVDGLQGWSRLYDRIAGALRVSVMERGEVVEKSPGQVQFDSPHRTERENNFCASNKAWATVADTAADALNHIAGSRLSKYRRLGVDHLAMPLNLNHMQSETLDTMWSVVSDRKACLKKYLDAKAQLLGLDKLSWFDLQAPLPSSGATGGKLSYDEACELVIESFTEFSPEFGDFAKMIIENAWIEVEDRPGKRQGGFSIDLPTPQQSRIFMTFTNTVDSMSTLAHEIGHSYHSWVMRGQPVFLRDYPMNLAETASTFAEAVLGENRLAVTNGNAEKLALLDTMLSDSVAFLMNIHARFLFEDQFHQERVNGEVSTERLCELMVETQKSAYLNSLADDGWNPYFWVSKLHFYIADWPFYNFPYAFGYLLSLGTYALAKDAPDFPAKFRDFLISTGSHDTEEAVENTLGYNLREREFWDRSIDIVEQRVNQFVELAAQN
jgi:pepF/M3 family oligoendopeptidase